MWNCISWVRIVLLVWEISKDGRPELNFEGSLSQVFGQKYSRKLIYLAIQGFETNLSRWPNCVITVRWCFLFAITLLRINLAFPDWFKKKKKRAPSSTAAGAGSALSQVLAGTRRQVPPQTQAAVSSHPFQSRHSVRNPSAKSVTAVHKHTP